MEKTTEGLFPNTMLFWVLVQEARDCARFHHDKVATRRWLSGFKWGWISHCHQEEDSGRYG